MKKKFIYDIFNLKNLSINEWSKNFFWPITPAKTQMILNKIHKIHMNCFFNEKNEIIKDCLQIYNHTWNPYIPIFNYLLLLKRIKKKKMKISYSVNSKVLLYLSSKSKNFPLKYENFNFKKRSYSNFKDIIKSVILNIKHKKSIFSKKILVLNNTNLLSSQLLGRIPEKIEIISAESVMKNFSKFTVNYDDKNIKELKKKILEIDKKNIEYATKELKIEIPDFVKKDIKFYQEKYFIEIYRLLCFLGKAESFFNSEAILLDTPKTFIRALSLISKKNSITVKGILHGNWMCHSITNRPHFNEFSIYDILFVDKKSHIPLFENTLQRHKTFNNKKPKFKSLNSNKFNIMKKNYKTSIPSTCKSVMILEVQLWCDDIRFELPETMILYEFYFRICKILDLLGYKIFFKKRPKSKKIDYTSFFKEINNIEIVYDDLQSQNTMKLADIIIFQYGLSSTFLPLMCSNKKLIYFDCGWEKWNPTVKNYLKKRCDVIKATFDSKNKISFSTVKFKKALRPNSKNNNNEFFNKYLS